MATTKCDCICVPRDEWEKLKGQKPKKTAPKKSVAKRKTPAKKTAPKKKTVAVQQLPAPTQKAIAEPTVSKPKTVPKKSVAKRKTPAKKTVKAASYKEPKSPTYKPKAKKVAKPKKPKVAEYRIVKDEPTSVTVVSTPYRGKVLERRERKPLISQSSKTPRQTVNVIEVRSPMPIEEPKSEKRTEKAHRGLLGRSRDRSTTKSLPAPSTSNSSALERRNDVKSLPAPSNQTLARRDEMKALPAPSARNEDPKTITLSDSEYRVTHPEDCSQGNFFQRTACKRRNRKNGF